MLLLTRRRGEKIKIGDDIEVIVLETGKQTRIGITAPKNIFVHREEVYNSIQEEKKNGKFQNIAC